MSPADKSILALSIVTCSCAIYVIWMLSKIHGA